MKRKSGYYDNDITQQELSELYHCWETILNSGQESRKTPQELHLAQVELNLPNQRVVNMDVARTRVNVISPQTSKVLERLLTLYCQNNQILYKQGMNEIMAPFMMFESCPTATHSSIYRMFDTFFSKYLLNLYFDEEFNSLEFLFRMVSIILEYHEPGLARFLSSNDLQPELYSTPWFMTLFANKLSIRMIYSFWEIYILEDDEFLIFYFIVGLLIYKKNSILQTREGELPQYLNEIIFESPQELIEVYRLALLIRKSTPKSLIVFCFQNGIFEKWENFDKIKRIFEHIIKINLFLVLPLELVVHIYGKRENQCPMLNKQCRGDSLCHFCKYEEPLKFNLLMESQEGKYLERVIRLSNDIRSMKSIINFVVIDIRLHKPRILIDCEIINIEQDMELIEEGFTLKYLEWRGRYHFVFLFEEFRFDDLAKCNQKEWAFCNKFIHILCSLGFQHLGILEGGFVSLQAEIRAEVDRSNNFNMSQQKQEPEELAVGNFHTDFPKDQKEYFNNHCILKPIHLDILPSTLVSLQELCVDPDSKFFCGKDRTLLITRNLFVFFKNSQMLREIIVYLSNTKSAMEFLMGVTKYNEAEGVEIESIHMLKYLSKVVVKGQPSYLRLNFYLPLLSRKKHLSSYLAGLRSLHPIGSLSSMKEEDYYCIYSQNPNGETLSRVVFESQDTKDLTECADFIKKNFERLESKLSSFDSNK